MHALRSKLPVLAVLVVASACNRCGEDVVAVGGNLVGPVCFEDGRRMAGALVVVVNEAAGVTREATADAEGDFEMLDVPAGDIELSASAEGITRTFALKLERDQLLNVGDTACRTPPPPPSTCSVEGTICNRHTGETVQQGEVFILLPDGQLAAVQTDEQGSFAMANIPPGEHVLTVRAPGFQRSFLVQCSAGETTTLDYGEGCRPPAANEGAIEGHFCDPESPGGNLAGAEVTATIQGQTFTEVTDVDGNVYLSPLPLGSYTVRVRRGTSFDHTFTAVDVQAGLVTRLQDPSECADQPQFGRLEGRVCSDDGAGAYTGQVALTQLGAPVDQVTTSADGLFRFEQIPPGPYTVTLVDSATQRSYLVDVVANQTAFVEEDLSSCGAPTNETCTDTVVTPEQTQDARIQLVVDRSGSMNDGAPGYAGDKWTAMKTALTNVTASLDATVEFGLVLYPDPSAGDACAEGSSQIPLGPNTASAIANRLNQVDADGNTPTAASLQVARQLVAPLVDDGRPISVLIATDGAPNCRAGCGFFSDCSDTNNTYAAVQALRDLGVLTYVLGIASDSTFHEVLNQMAIIGGTALSGTTKYYDAASEAALQSALEAIAQRVTSCRVDVAESLYSASSVTVKIGDTVQPRDPTHQNGWDVVNAYSVELYGAACDLVSSSGQSVTVTRCVEE